MKTIYKPVEMISLTNVGGQLRPVRFRIEKDDGSLMTAKVVNVMSINHTKIAGERKQLFRCELQINDTVRICELRYHQDTCIWELFKI